MKIAPQFATRRFPRGAYWICDPCYAYPKDEWMDFCHKYPNSPSVMEYGDHQYFVWGTSCGDGVYPVMGPKSGQCGVDSGLLAVIPHDLAVLWGAVDYLKDLEKRALCVSIRTARAFEIEERGGDAFFGDYYVDTAGVLDEEFWDEDEDEE
jgi:hypothetical protein